MLKKILALFFLVLLFSVFTKTGFAAVIFEDNFNDYLDGSFPTKWEPLNISDAPCPGNPWTVESGSLKSRITSSGCANNIVPTNLEWPVLSDNYIFEADLNFTSGTDHNIGYRQLPSALYEIHFITPGNDFSLSFPPSTINTSVSIPYIFNTNYRIKTIINEKNIKIYINEILVRDLDTNVKMPAGKIALRIGSGSGGITQTWFDNVRVLTLNHYDPVNEGLSVPLLKQTNSLWGSDIYNSANIWSPSATGIDRWGCAITSAAMVLQYNKITKLPNSQDLNPGTLNSWLKQEPDGYIRNGLLNWQAISRMSKSSSSNNPDFDYDALEYQRENSQNNTQLAADLQNGIPGILSVPGHFIVAKGLTNSSFKINDPFYDRSTLQEYGNSYASYGKYIPSNTDISYLMFVVDPGVDIVLKDGTGSARGDVVLESPISDPLGLQANSGGPLKVIYFAKPETDNYTVEVFSNNSSRYQLDGYLYDQDGNIKLFSEKGIVGVGIIDSYSILFNKINIDQSVVTKPITTFTTLLSDVDYLHQSGNITKKGTYNFLIRKISQAQLYELTDPQRAIDLLTGVRQQLIDYKKRGIDVFASNYIISEISLLIGNLN